MPIQLSGAYTSGAKPIRDANGRIIGYSTDDQVGGFGDQGMPGQSAPTDTNQGWRSQLTPIGGAPPGSNGAGDQAQARQPYDPGAAEEQKAVHRVRLQQLADMETNAATQTLHDQMIARGGGPQTIIPDAGGDYQADPSVGPSSMSFTDPTTGQTIHQDGGPVPQGYRRKSVGSYSPVAAQQAAQDAGPGAFTDSSSDYMDQGSAMTLHALQTEAQDRALAEKYHSETMGLQEKAFEAAKYHDDVSLKTALAMLQDPVRLAQVRGIDAQIANDSADRAPARQVANAEAGSEVANIGAAANAAKDPTNILQPQEIAALPQKYRALYNASIPKGPLAASAAVRAAQAQDSGSGFGAQEDTLAQEVGSLSQRSGWGNSAEKLFTLGLGGTPGVGPGDIQSTIDQIQPLADKESAITGEPVESILARMHAKIAPKATSDAVRRAISTTLKWQ